VPVAFETMGPVGRFFFSFSKAALFFGSILTKMFSLSFQLKVPRLALTLSSVS
jgi:hypothetical protein